MNAFVVRESCDLSNYMLTLADDFFQKCPDLTIPQSALILAARLLGLSYPDYLRFCISKGGTIIGRTGFPHIIFKDNKNAEAICSLINAEWTKFYAEYERIVA